ncbi:MAG: hypothetical protein V4568_14745 [Pseudomonadota bacterium]
MKKLILALCLLSSIGSGCAMNRIVSIDEVCQNSGPECYTQETNRRLAIMQAFGGMRMQQPTQSYQRVPAYQPARPIQTNCTAVNQYGNTIQVNCTSQQTGVDTSMYNQ